MCTCRPVYLNTHVWEVRRGRRTRPQPFNTTVTHLRPAAGRPHSKQTPLTLTAVPGPLTRPCPRSCRTTPGSRTWTLPVPQTAPPRSPASTERLGTGAYPVRAMCLDVCIYKYRYIYTARQLEAFSGNHLHLHHHSRNTHTTTAPSPTACLLYTSDAADES